MQPLFEKYFTNYFDCELAMQTCQRQPSGPTPWWSILDKKNPPFRGDSFTFLYIQSVTFDLVMPCAKTTLYSPE